MPPTTNAVRAWRALNRPPSDSWVEWAVHLLTEGVDTPTLCIVAGLRPPFDYFDTIRLVDKALAEMSVPLVPRDAAVEAYAAELVQTLLEASEAIDAALIELCDLCIETGYLRSLMNFYLLRWARDDLRTREVQFYWDGADRSNISGIIREEARRWLEERKRAA